MIAFLLFVAVIAQETSETTTGCGKGMYFNINSGEGGKCEAVNFCNETNIDNDNLSGCNKCGTVAGDEQNYFNFRGQCHQCNCGNEDSGDKIKCTDNIGCPKCAKYHVMVETRNPDGSVMYTCTELPNSLPDLGQQGVVYSEYQLHGKDTRDFCLQWGATGCVKCGINETSGLLYYLNASMCYPNPHCTNYTGSDETGYTCYNCTQAKNQNEQSYYLLNGFCTQCDGNCTKCELTTGECNECFPGYYPLNGKSKKCYQCDPNCDITSCVQQANAEGTLLPGSCTKCRSDVSRNETYYLVANKYCIRMAASCLEADSNVGCTKCKEGYFLVPHHYNGENNFHYKIAGVRLGMCVPHQDACPSVNRTDTGCIGCSAGYVVDTMKWTYKEKEYSIGICSGAASVFIVALIALLVLLF